MKCIIYSHPCIIKWKFCQWTSLWSLLTATSLMCCNNCSSIAEFRVSTPSRSNSSLFSSEMYAILRLFQIMVGFISRHISSIGSMCPWIGPNHHLRNQVQLWVFQASVHSYFCLASHKVTPLRSSLFSLRSFISCSINCKYGEASIIVGSSVGSSIVSNPISDVMLGWLRSAVLVEVGLENWWCVHHGVHLATGLWTSLGTTTTGIGHHLCIFYMCAVWPYLYSMYICVQICIFISRQCYFIKTSLNDILPLPYIK